MFFIDVFGVFRVLGEFSPFRFPFVIPLCPAGTSPVSGEESVGKS